MHAGAACTHHTLFVCAYEPVCMLSLGAHDSELLIAHSRRWRDGSIGTQFLIFKVQCRALIQDLYLMAKLCRDLEFGDPVFWQMPAMWKKSVLYFSVNCKLCTITTSTKGYLSFIINHLSVLLFHLLVPIKCNFNLNSLDIAANIWIDSSSQWGEVKYNITNIFSSVSQVWH